VLLSQKTTKGHVVSAITVPRRRSIKSRMLAIALIPSLALLLVGLGISGYLIDQGVQTYRWADNLRSTVQPGTSLVTNVQLERWLGAAHRVGLRRHAGDERATGNGDRPPPLPHRRRQANLAPQLASGPRTARNGESAERVRAAISAFQRGTNQARDFDGGEN
jgi:hypothetical protein